MLLVPVIVDFPLNPPGREEDRHWQLWTVLSTIYRSSDPEFWDEFINLVHWHPSSASLFPSSTPKALLYPSFSYQTWPTHILSLLSYRERRDTYSMTLSETLQLNYLPYRQTMVRAFIKVEPIDSIIDLWWVFGTTWRSQDPRESRRLRFDLDHSSTYSSLLAFSTVFFLWREPAANNAAFIVTCLLSDETERSSSWDVSNQTKTKDWTPNAPP